MVPSQDRRQFARAEAKWPVIIISPDSQTFGEIRASVKWVHLSTVINHLLQQKNYVWKFSLPIASQ